MKNVLIIGAGFGGLAAAALLAKKGYKVVVLEKNDQIGGRAGLWKDKGFTFDMGPSWYLMPDVFERFFRELGEDVNQVFKLTRLDPGYKIFFGNNDCVSIASEFSKNKALFESLEPNGAELLQKYVDLAKYQYDIAMDQFIYRDYSSIFDLFNRKLLTEGSKLRAFESLDKFTQRFFNSDRARQILLYNIVFLGGTPKSTPSLYSIMSYIDFGMGVWYPHGGMHAVAEAFHKIATKCGAEIKLEHTVTKLEVHDKKVTTVVTDKGAFSADIVINNADYAFAETQLLDTKYQTYPQSYWNKKVIAPSAFILYLGLSKKIKSLDHHNLFLENNWMTHFESIFESPNWPDKPSYYVCVPSKTDPSVAPAEGENLFILVPVAAGLEDTDEVRQQYGEKILSHLEQLIGESLKDAIVTKRIFSHRDFQTLYNAYQGTALGLTHTLFQTAMFRPSHRSKKVSNLWYTGQYTHPGIGVPMCLISSQIVTSEIEKTYG